MVQTLKRNSGILVVVRKFKTVSFVFHFVEHDYFRQKEIKLVLDILNNEKKKGCTREWLNGRGMIVQEDLENNVFSTLSKAFGESTQEKVLKEFSKVRC